ncbi:MAG: 3TM-type holin [Parvibaculales bacterium]
MLSFLTKQATEPIEVVGNVLDALFTSDKERLDKKAVLARIAQQPTLVQGEIGKIEASHKSVFVAGWRPFIGWVCGLELFYNFVLRDLMVWGLMLSRADTPPPVLHIDVLTTILYALLGLGGMRTFEKLQGRTK